MGVSDSVVGMSVLYRTTEQQRNFAVGRLNIAVAKIDSLEADIERYQARVKDLEKSQEEWFDLSMNFIKDLEGKIKDSVFKP